MAQFLPETTYPEYERPKLAALEKLFREWHQHFATNQHMLEKHAADEMVFDGFYPYYFSQKVRVLFIGRESRGISGDHNMDVILPKYCDGKRIGGQHLNTNNFHSRMLYIAYGINNGMPVWQTIPYANEIGDTFGTAEGLSFAFMNISKLSNESEAWQSDWGVIDTQFELSARNRRFNEEEVAILEPHIVITMNLQDKLASLGKLTPIQTTSMPHLYHLDGAGYQSLLIDSWHFTAGRKGDIVDYYAPICDAIRRYRTTNDMPHDNRNSVS